MEYKIDTKNGETEIDCTLTREIMPGITLAIELMPDEIESIFRTRKYAYQLENARRNIDEKLYNVTDDGENPEAFETRYGFAYDQLNEPEFVDACVEAFGNRADDSVANDVVWEAVIEEQLQIFGQKYFNVPFQKED